MPQNWPWIRIKVGVFCPLTMIFVILRMSGQVTNSHSTLLAFSIARISVKKVHFFRHTITVSIVFYSVHCLGISLPTLTHLSFLNFILFLVSLKFRKQHLRQGWGPIKWAVSVQKPLKRLTLCICWERRKRTILPPDAGSDFFHIKETGKMRK